MISLGEFNFIISKFFRTPQISDRLTFSTPVNDYLINEMNNYINYLEYGSGSSTCYFSTYANLNVVSVESDSSFAKAVKQIISSDKTKIYYSETGLSGYWGVPLFFASSREKGWKYVNTPWRNLGETYQPDVVLIDGRYRIACAMNILLRAANKFSVIIMIDDYLEREEYIYFEKYCKLTKMVDRMAFFEYQKIPIREEMLAQLKLDLEVYLKKYF
jgi:protein O-GlcNAc transferase